jgi:probable HAF family extracellular repeat protein
MGVALPGALAASAKALSPDGTQVCGNAYFSDPAADRRGFLWQDGIVQEIGILPHHDHTRSTAEDVNDSGVVIGLSSNSALVGKGYVWRNGVMAELNDLIPPGINLDITFVSAINNAGQIACRGRVFDDNGIPNWFVGVRLTPIASPPGDCDCNGVVNIDDLLAVINQWGPTIPTTSADFNDDGIVSVDDLMEVLRRWSQ